MGMGETLNNIRETNIIGSGCIERFLPLEAPGAEILREKHVALAGLSKLAKPYEIGRIDSSFHAVLICTSGSGLLYHDGGIGDVRASSLVILPAGTSYHYRINGRSWGLLWFHIKKRRIWDHLSRRGITQINSIEMTPILSAANGLLAEAKPGVRLKRGVELYAGLIDYRLQELIGSADTSKDREVEARLLHVWRAVENDFARKWTVAELAKLAHYSAGHFHRLVVQRTGKTPMRVVTEMKLHHASNLLRRSGETVATIAYRVGFENQFAFSSAFKRQFGVSPREWRETE